MAFVSPAVFVREQDLSGYLANLSTTIAAMVGGASKGPRDVPTLVTSAAEFVNTFGNPTPNHYGPYAALQFLAEGGGLWYERVAGVSAFKSIFQLPTAERTGVQSALVTVPGTGYTAIPAVAITGDGVGATAVARISGGAVVGVDITNPGYGYTSATAGFSGGGGASAAATLTVGSSGDVAATVSSVDGTFNVAVGTKTLIINYLDRSSGVLVVTPHSITLTEGGTQSATTVVSDITGTSGYSGWHFTASVSSLKVKLTAAIKDSLHGVQVDSTSTFAGFTDNERHYGTDVDAFPATLIGSITGPVAIIAGVNDTLTVKELDRRTGTLIVTSRVFSLTPGGSRTLVQIADEVSAAALAGTFNIAADAASGNFILTSAGLENELFGLQIDDSTTIGDSAADTLGLNAATAYYGAKAKWLFQAASEGAWGDQVNVKVAAGATVGTFAVTVAVGGVRQETFNNLSADPSSADYVETRINSVSRYITVTDNAYIGADPALTASVGSNLAFGADGLSDLQDSDFIGLPVGYTGGATGLQAFRSPATIDINLVAVPGISSASVLNEVIDICETRADCFYVMDAPLALSKTQVADWHNGAGAYGDHQAFDTSYAGLFWPWAEVIDPVNNLRVWTPPSGHVLRAFAQIDRKAESWFAAAGTTFGRIVPALRLETNPTQADCDFLYGDGNAVNPIIRVSGGQGGGKICIWGNRTLQRKATALDRIGVRRLMIYLEKSIATGARDLVFGQNDTNLWRSFVNMAQPLVASVQSRRGVSDFKVRCDKKTNPPDAIDRGEMHAQVIVKPEKAAEFIVLDFAVTKQGSDFSEISTF